MNSVTNWDILTGLIAILISAMSVSGQIMESNIDENIATATLSSGKTFPLVGIEVGKSHPSMISPMVSKAMQKDKKTFLFDTFHHSDNEHFVSSGIINGVSRMGKDIDGKVTVHVLSKLWHTHLGYERTALSVKKLIEGYKKVLDDERIDLKIHVLLDWPRCYEGINFMDCKGEEEGVSEEMKSAGPPPHLERNNAWKQSWKALEDIYTAQDKYSMIESIGVSNFQLNDMKAFEDFALIQPHIFQMNAWSLLNDPDLIDYCQYHDIHVQVYNAMDMIVKGSNNLLVADYHLEKVASDLSKEAMLSSSSSPSSRRGDLTKGQIALAWLIQNGISVIPGTTQFNRLQENSALSLAQIPELSDYQVLMVAHSVEAFLSGKDMEKDDIKVKVTFEAKSSDLFLYQRQSNGSEKSVAYIPQGKQFDEITYPKNDYVLYDAQNNNNFLKYSVVAELAGRHEKVLF